MTTKNQTTETNATTTIALPRREYLAAMAMQGLLASSTQLSVNVTPSLVAEMARNLADAMIRELDRHD